MFIVKNQTPEDCVGVVFIIFFVILIIFIICYGCWRYCNGDETMETFANKTQTMLQEMLNSGMLYNPLYTSPDIRSQGSFIYTQPQGDVDAMEYAGNGSGTQGSFLPLQGRAAGVFMKNSSGDNLSLPSKDPGNIGSYPNYTDQVQTSRMTAGFNNFGAPFQNNKNAQLSNKDYSNSYLIDGANQRVCNSGQKCDNLPAQDWWPTVKKGSHGFALQASDAMVPCNQVPKSIENCKDQGSERFLRSRYEPRWKSVFQKQ